MSSKARQHNEDRCKSRRRKFFTGFITELKYFEGMGPSKNIFLTNLGYLNLGRLELELHKDCLVAENRMVDKLQYKVKFIEGTSCLYDEITTLHHSSSFHT
jgi:hypothetical protein